MNIPHDDELIMMSALQHYCFCPRQCALIYVENLWRENHLTTAGKLLHEHVDHCGTESRPGIKRLTALRLISRRLGVIGVADMVELHLTPQGWLAYPIEYKHGKPKPNRADEVQLCAQAMALEEMRHEIIPEGALFYATPRRRTIVSFDDSLRKLTLEIAQAVHALIREARTPPPIYTNRCDACSLYDLCLPKQVNTRLSAQAWIRQQLETCGL